MDVSIVNITMSFWVGDGHLQNKITYENVNVHFLPVFGKIRPSDVKFAIKCLLVCSILLATNTVSHISDMLIIFCG